MFSFEKFIIEISLFSFPFINKFDSFKFFIVEHIFLFSLFLKDDIIFFKFQFKVYVSYFDVMYKLKLSLFSSKGDLYIFIISLSLFKSPYLSITLFVFVEVNLIIPNSSPDKIFIDKYIKI